MGEKDLRIRAVELHRLSIGCGECKSAVVFEALAQRGPGATICPNCSMPMPNVSEIVATFRSLYEKLQTVRGAADFLVKMDDK